MRKGNWKLVKQAALPSKNELYDLEKDPGEKNNLADQYPGKVKELEMILNRYAAQSEAALFLSSYMPFVKQHFDKAALAYEGDEDAGQPKEKPVLPY